MKYIFLCSLLFFSSYTFAKASFDLILEAGSVWQHRNDTQIPSIGGTRLALDELDDGPFAHYRVEGIMRLNKNHAVRGLYAPLDIKVTGRPTRAIIFDGKTFNDTEDLTVNYRFNSYRLTYFYGFLGFGEDQINLGITLKIRDAETKFSQGATVESYSNVGFVPLFYFEYQKSLSSSWLFNFNVDAATASQGRAVDAALKLRRKFYDSSSFGFGFRTLEGGANNDKVYTFSWFNYAVLDITIGF
jgi:hypothetical protein